MDTAPMPQVQTSWWNRNWKWFLPTGCCLGTILAIVVAVVVFGVGIVGIITGVGKVLKSSEAYQTAVMQAKANDKVIAALGTPIEEGFPMGSVNTNNDAGDADLSIPISGPKGKGTIYVTGTKSAGTWTYSKMLVKITGTDQEIDLKQ